MAMHAFLLSGLLLTALNATSIEQAKRLKYSEQTSQNIKDYKMVLESLAKHDDPEALMMLAEAYETGSHWKKDPEKAIHYYILAAEHGSETSLLRLGHHYEEVKDLERSKHYYQKAWQAGRSDAIKPLLMIALTEEDKTSIKSFKQEANRHNITLDDQTQEKIRTSLESTSQRVSDSVLHDMEDATFKGTKTYIQATMKTLVSLEGAYKNLGYKVEKYLIHNGLEPTIEIILYRDSTLKIDEEMAFFIAGDNALRKAILGTLIWANEMSLFLEEELEYTVSGMEIEVGSSATAKLVTERM